MRWIAVLALTAGCSLHYTRAKDSDPFAGTQPYGARAPLAVDLLRIDRSEYARGVFQEGEALAGLESYGFARNSPASGLMLRTESAMETPGEPSLALRCLPLATLLLFPIIQPRQFEARYTLLDKRTGDILKVYRRSTRDTEIVGWVTVFGAIPALFMDSLYGGEQRIEQMSMQSVVSELSRDMSRDADFRERILDAANAVIPARSVHIQSIRDAAGRDVTNRFAGDLLRALQKKNIEAGPSGASVLVSMSDPFAVGSGGSHMRTQITVILLSESGEKRAATFQVTFTREEIAEKLANVVRSLLYESELKEAKKMEL
jgi:hypothetical protein